MDEFVEVVNEQKFIYLFHSHFVPRNKGPFIEVIELHRWSSYIGGRVIEAVEL